MAKPVSFKAMVVYRYRVWLLILLTITTILLAYFASRVEKSYDYFSTLPKKSAVLKDFENLKQTFQLNTNSIVLGVSLPSLFTDTASFRAYQHFCTKLRQSPGVERTLSIFDAVSLQNNVALQRFDILPLFDSIYTYPQLSKRSKAFFNLPFYRSLLYHNDSYWILLSLQESVAQTKQREEVVAHIERIVQAYQQSEGTKVHVSGLPFIRTKIAAFMTHELSVLIAVSAVCLLLCVFLFYRNVTDVLVTFMIVGVGVVWTLGTTSLLGYKLTVLTAIVPTLIIIIGVPNCIYFLNKYHALLAEGASKDKALAGMLASMGKITLFCNLTMAIGFLVFMTTKSQLLSEFGLLAGLNIGLKLGLSYVLIPLLLYYLPTYSYTPVRKRLFAKQLLWIQMFTHSIHKYQKYLYASLLLLVGCAVWGISCIRFESHILDDVPTDNQLVGDLRFFEKEIRGIMPVEITIRTKRKTPLTSSLSDIQSIERFTHYLEGFATLSKPFSWIEVLKFARQSYYFGDTSSYSLPTEIDAGFIAPYLHVNTSSVSTLHRLLRSYLDSTQREMRISVGMADVGSTLTAQTLTTIQQHLPQYIDTSRLQVRFSGSAVTFLEGNSFIMHGLEESILWALVLIGLCVLYLFRSVSIMLLSMLLNLIPLVLTMGIMGLMRIYFQPSTVIIYSIVLGISVDITIRYLVTFRQLSYAHPSLPIQDLTLLTLQDTLLSIVFTALSLILGFLVFMYSDFGSIHALGWLTAISLSIATVVNLVFLPLLLNSFFANKKP